MVFRLKLKRPQGAFAPNRAAGQQAEAHGKLIHLRMLVCDIVIGDII